MGRYGTPDEDRSAASRSPTGQADRPARQSVLPQSTVGVQSLTHLHATVGPTFERVQVDRGWPGTRPESLHPRTVAGSLSSRIRRHRGSPKRANSRRGTLCFWSPAQLDCDPHVGRAPVRDPRAAATTAAVPDRVRRRVGRRGGNVPHVGFRPAGGARDWTRISIGSQVEPVV